MYQKRIAGSNLKLQGTRPPFVTPANTDFPSSTVVYIPSIPVPPFFRTPAIGTFTNSISSGRHTWKRYCFTHPTNDIEVSFVYCYCRRQSGCEWTFHVPLPTVLVSVYVGLLGGYPKRGYRPSTSIDGWAHEWPQKAAKATHATKWAFLLLKLQKLSENTCLWTMPPPTPHVCGEQNG